MATGSVAVALFLKGRIAESIAASREAIAIATRAGLIRELYAALMTLRVQLAATCAPSEEQREVQLQMRHLVSTHGLGSQDWIVRELGMLHSEGDWDGFMKLLPQVAEPDRAEGDIARLMGTFAAVARTGPGEVRDLDGARRRVASHGHSGMSAFWSAALLLLTGRPLDAVRFAATVRDEDVKRTYWGLIPASIAHAIGLFAARECDDRVAGEQFVASLRTVRPLPVGLNFNRRYVALADADSAERAGNFEAALSAYGAVLVDCERSQYADTSVSYLSSLIRQRRAELYLRAQPSNVASAQAEVAALLPYWQKAKATWYLGQLRAWAEKSGLAFPAEESAPDASSGQLTHRELEVARLVAQGMTNREIAARLTLSVRTAESHVEQIRSKLGFRRRAQIATWITERYGATRTS
jgi:DNA-binding NarL/FixJ family response regulator